MKKKLTSSALGLSSQGAVRNRSPRLSCTVTGLVGGGSPLERVYSEGVSDIHYRKRKRMSASTSPKGNPFGGIIDLSAGETIAKAPRGATKDFEPDLLDLMSTMTATHAIAVTGFVVKRSAYPATDAGETAYKNERQRIGAVLRSHASEAGIGKISINWHPDGDYPQASIKA